MAITENWNIRSRSHACHHTGIAFTEGEVFSTALFDEPQSEELIRRDFSLTAWDEARAAATPFSFWKSVYEAPVSNARPEVVEKETAETLLRRLIEEDNPGSENTRYILAVMLERKKQLRQTATRETDDATFLIYEQPKSGEVYIIRDPELKLDQVEAVQREVSLMLTPRADAPADAPPEPPAQPTAASESAEAAKPTEEPSHEETPEELPADSPDAAEPETSQEPTA
ncbi:MAG: hypothetical protein ACK5CW_07610 [Verrucomicrobiota bacterium]